MHTYVTPIISSWNAFATYINGKNLLDTTIPQQSTTNSNFQVIETISKVIAKLLCKLANHTVTTDAYYVTNADFRVIEVTPEQE